MKLRIIGCSSAYPTDSNPTSGYLLEGMDGRKVLLDIGSGVLMKLKSFMSFNEIDDVFITHMHFDHCSDAGVAIYDRIVKKDLGETDRSLVFHTPVNDRTFLLESPVSTVHTIDESSRVQIGSMTFTFLPTRHSENCHAIKVEEGDKTLVYTGDTRYFPELLSFAEGCNLLLSECSMERRYDAGKYGHMNTDDAAKLALGARPDILALVHTPSYAEEDEILSEVSRDYDGLTFYGRPGDVFEI